MAEYIKREDALKMASNDSEIYIAINCIPVADVVEVKHGKWIPYSAKHSLYTCSECHSTPRDKTPYCPICGAKMEGK